MSKELLHTPVLFLIFNRPDTTIQVFEQIRKMKPAFLYLAADGPRKDKRGEKETCNKVREIVLSNIDWECELKTLLRDENLGCGKAVSEAITWFFEHVEEGIILEDDCLPDLSFFKYCEVMLDRHRDDENIMHVGGNNFQFGKKRDKGDYYFSSLSHIWGWATWRNSWKKYEFDLTKTDFISEQSFRRAFNNNQLIIDFYNDVFNCVANNLIDTWDYQWMYTLIKNNGLAICPNVNLVQNIGFGNDATHTLQQTNWNSKNIALPLKSFIAPCEKIINYEADKFVLQEILGIGKKNKQMKFYSFLHKLKKIVQKYLK
jgi:hypothetical protein